MKDVRPWRPLISPPDSPQRPPGGSQGGVGEGGTSNIKMPGCVCWGSGNVPI